MTEKMTPEERELWDARADEEGWGHAIELLEPMREIARMFGSPELTRVLEKASAEAEAEYDRALDVLEPLEEGHPERVPPRRDRDLAALACVNGALSEAIERLDAVDSESFGAKEDYWRAKRAISEAGGIVVREHCRRRREGGGP